MLSMFKQLSREDRNKVKTTDRNVTDSTFVRSKVHVSVLKLGVKLNCKSVLRKQIIGQFVRLSA